MPLKINDTSDYHINDLDSLGWELTISGMLEPPGSPCRKILKKNGTFGNLLFDYLSSIIPFDNIKKIAEIGGGYGYLMRDFLSRNTGLAATMIDISPFLMKKQKAVLDGFNAEFIEGNFFNIDDNLLSGFDMAVLNEIIGDFPTLCNMIYSGPDREVVDGNFLEAVRLIQRYNLPVPQGIEFNFNLGAVQAVEKLCAAGEKYIYMSEHSCEASAPEKLRDMLKIESNMYPSKIALKGHDEYTIKFSHLENVARSYNYNVIRGKYADFVKVDFDDRINFILSSSTSSGEHEIIRQFVGDLFLYEYLLLVLD